MFAITYISHVCVKSILWTLSICLILPALYLKFLLLSEYNIVLFYNASLSLLSVNRPMHLRDRKLETSACRQWEVGGGEDTEGITFHQYISSKD